MASTLFRLVGTSLLLSGVGAVAAVGQTAAPQRVPAPQIPTRASWLQPDTVLHPPGALPLVLKASPTAGITTIRVFVPLDESFAEAGIGRVLAQVAAGRVRGVAARVGASFVALRTPHGIAYSVTGSDEDFDYLAFVLRQGMAEPAEQAVVVRRLAGRTRATLERGQETGRGWVSADLVGHLCPTLPSEAGLTPSLTSLTPERLRRFWRRTHLKSRASVIVISRAPRSVIFSALRTLGLPEDVSAPPETGLGPSSEPPPPQVLRRWYGEARPLPRDAAAETQILAKLLDEPADASGMDYELFVELRRLRCSDALLVVGTAYRSNERAMRARVSSVLGELTGSLTDENVRVAAQGVRSALVREVAHPAGLAAALGREGTDQGDPEGLARLHERLTEVGFDAMKSYLDRVAILTPLQSELRW